jgi:hypothetical protein
MLALANGTDRRGHEVPGQSRGFLAAEHLRRHHPACLACSRDRLRGDRVHLPGRFPGEPAATAEGPNLTNEEVREYDKNDELYWPVGGKVTAGDPSSVQVASNRSQTLHELFQADAGGHVDAVGVNGIVDTVDSGIRQAAPRQS